MANDKRKGRSMPAKSRPSRLLKRTEMDPRRSGPRDQRKRGAITDQLEGR